nr:MAG TPA: hypothetical protein [Caudoviricetes sp.]
MKTFDTFKKHDFDTRRQKLLNNLIARLGLNGEWYTEQTYNTYIQSHKVYTFVEYGKIYHVLYIHGVYRLVDDENGEQYESSDIKDFERLLLKVLY